MKKSLFFLTVLVGLISCKQKETSGVEKGTKDSELVQNQDGSIPANSNSEEASENLINSNQAALQKAEDESYTFKYNLKKGETYPFNLKISHTQSMSAGGRSMNVSSTRTVDFDYFVEEVKGNQFKLKATFKGFSESFKSPDEQSMSYNTSSAKPADKDVAKSWAIYKAITGQTFQMDVDNRGKVIAVNGLDKVINNAMAKLKNDFTAQEQTEVKKLLNAALGKEAIKVQFEESLNIFPDKSLKIGEKWEDTQNISEGPVKGQNKVIRTFEGIKDGKATILVNGVQDVSGKETQGGVTANMKNHATIDGKVDLDLETGWLKKVHITKKESVNTTYQQGDKKETEAGTQTIVTSVN